jgi:hypothetical protein
MSRFQLCWTGEQVIAGSIILHAQLQAKRHEGWALVGILTLTEDEWTEFGQLCRQFGIPVVCDRDSAKPGPE